MSASVLVAVDDYPAEPYSSRVLTARVRGLPRRSVTPPDPAGLRRIGGA
ncbi:MULTISPECIES: hypothetical protein [Catenuloplanes]|uniref:DNA-binding response OmpR family regulator n=1 Tax=Catenuloplanes niger TaxID=587534 RepID=A0AAE3ZWQ8_9ACTN|nr:hypothetical protein [Catenuloplanes niger]MDR7327307.1 DNA-binding response OmpR family regulator [Catenuloplanes niger]